jgi:hypothetical protein
MGQASVRKAPTVFSRVEELKNQYPLHEAPVACAFPVLNAHLLCSNKNVSGISNYLVRKNCKRLWSFLSDDQAKVKCVVGGRGVGKSTSVFAYVMNEATNRNKSFVYIQGEMNTFTILYKFERDKRRTKEITFKDHKFESENDFFRFMKGQLPFETSSESKRTPPEMDYIIIDAPCPNLWMYLYNYVKDLPNLKIILVSHTMNVTGNQSHNTNDFSFFHFYGWKREEYLKGIHLKIFSLQNPLTKHTELIAETDLEERYYYSGGCLSLFLQSDTQFIFRYYSFLLLQVENIQEIVRELFRFKRGHWQGINPSFFAHPMISATGSLEYDLLSEGFSHYLLTSSLNEIASGKNGADLGSYLFLLSKLYADQDYYHFLSFLLTNEKYSLKNVMDGEECKAFQRAEILQSEKIFDEAELVLDETVAPLQSKCYFFLKYEFHQEHCFAMRLGKDKVAQMLFYYHYDEGNMQRRPGKEAHVGRCETRVINTLLKHNYQVHCKIISNDEKHFALYQLAPQSEISVQLLVIQRQEKEISESSATVIPSSSSSVPASVIPQKRKFGTDSDSDRRSSMDIDRNNTSYDDNDSDDEESTHEMTCKRPK